MKSIDEPPALMSEMSPSIGAVLLAAGAGSRFVGAHHKLVAPFRGRPVIAWSIEAMLGAGFDNVAVVGGAADISTVAEALSVTVLPNERWAEGQATSLQVALRWARGLELDALVVGLADQPLVPSEAWRAVAAAPGAIVIAEFEGRRRPPVRLAQSVWNQLPVVGDDGARVVMAGNPDLVTEVRCVGNPADIDTLEDLRQWS